MVYENICRELQSDIAVVAPRRRYIDGGHVEGWAQFDSMQPYDVSRVDLLQPQVKPPASTSVETLQRLLVEDLPFFRRIASEVSRIVDQVRPDVLCLGDLFALFWLGGYLRWRRTLPTVHYVHAEEVTTDWGSRMYKYGSLAALRRADAVVTVSNFTKAELTRRGVAEERIHVITNGVDLERFQPGEKSEAILIRHDLSENRVLLTVGRLEERKGQDKMIEALPRILDAVPDLKYVVVGEGGYRPALEVLARKHGVQDRVVFAGRVPWEELPDYYRTADVFAMPNRTLASGETEGFGLVFLEANACGKPVVGGRAGGVPDAVSDGETGILVDGRSTDEIVEAVVRLFEDATLRERMGRAGVERARHFGWTAKAQEFRDLCRSLSAFGKRMTTDRAQWKTV